MIPSTHDKIVANGDQRLSSADVVRRCRVGFFGIFGLQNLGNECTLQSILYNARKRRSEDDFYAVSFNPDDTGIRHNIHAFAVTRQKFPAVVRGGAISKAVRLCRRIPGEFSDWLGAIRTLRGTDLLIMTGTGMLTDYMTKASGFPYDVFRWSAAGR